MASKESQVAAQVRLSQWAMEIQECQNRPRDMTVNEWCEQRDITKANYYWRLKRVRQTCLKQLQNYFRQLCRSFCTSSADSAICTGSDNNK